jgi:hypothetical protein
MVIIGNNNTHCQKWKNWFVVFFLNDMLIHKLLKYFAIVVLIVIVQ